MAPTAGMLRYNTDTKRIERSTDGGGTWAEVDLTGATLITIPAYTPTAGSVGAVVQSTTLTGTQNNFVVSVGRHVIVDCLNASLLSITGISKTDKQDGDIVEFICTNTVRVDFSHRSAGSSAGNKLVNFVSSCVTSINGATGNAQGGYVRYVYRSSFSVWVLTAHEQGGYIDNTDFTYSAGGGGSLTYSNGYNRYKLTGKTLVWNVFVAFAPTGTVTVANLILPITGATLGAGGYNPMIFWSSTFYQGRCNGAVGGTTVQFDTINGFGTAQGFQSGQNIFQGTAFFELT
jgi:hypothetical protein